MALAHEVEQIGKKLANVGGANKVMQMQLVQTAAKVNPKVFVIQHAKVFVVADQQFIAVGVEGRRLQLCRAWPPAPPSLLLKISLAAGTV